MGYESRIYFVKNLVGSKCLAHEGVGHSDMVASIDLCKLGCSATIDEFLDAFSEETPFAITIPDYDAETGKEVLMDIIEDKYGDRICYAPDKEYLYELANRLCEEIDYDRLRIFRDMLKTAKDSEDIYIVHYGW